MLLPVRRAIVNVSNAGESKGSRKAYERSFFAGSNDGTRPPSLERFEVFVNGHSLASSAGMAKAGFMHVVVLFESLFGNTREVAEAIADGARTADPASEVARVRVAEADLEVVAAADLLVVGGPTHIRGMTSGMSRKMGLAAEEKKDEAEQHEIQPGAEGPGVRNWFADLPKATKGFIIEGTEGPLRAGEPDRARAWGANLVQQTAG